jgi:hypothetical protein
LFQQIAKRYLGLKQAGIHRTLRLGADGESNVTAPTKNKSEPPRPDRRSTAPVIDLTQRTQRDGSAPPVSGFAAQIDGASMADLIQLECTRGLTRSIRVSAGENTGFLYFDQGALVHAIAGSLTGEPAAREILRWQGGSVRPSNSYWVKPPTIQLSWQALLISAAQAEDEANRSDSEIFLRIDSDSLAPESAAEESAAEEIAAEEIAAEEIANVNDEPADGILRLVRLSPEGTLLESRGELGEFSDAAAYCAQLAQIVGEGLGLASFDGLECTTANKVMLLYRDGNQVVALEAEPKAPLTPHRKKAGV